MAAQRHGISPEHLYKAIRELSSDVALGLGGSEMNTPFSSSQTNGMSQRLQSLQRAMLVAANKKEPTALKDDEEMPMCPIN
eukprot:97217-Ditylum_brightwellii.AAC.1